MHHYNDSRTCICLLQTGPVEWIGKVEFKQGFAAPYGSLFGPLQSPMHQLLQPKNRALKSEKPWTFYLWPGIIRPTVCKNSRKCLFTLV